MSALRVIKFRAWIIPDETMLRPDEVGMLDGEASVGVGENIILLQFIGIYDMNSREIYEGDIVKMHENWLPLGWGKDVAVVTYNSELCGFDPYATYDCDCGVYLNGNNTEVIGNVYENPELMEAKP